MAQFCLQEIFTASSTYISSTDMEIHMLKETKSINIHNHNQLFTRESFLILNMYRYYVYYTDRELYVQVTVHRDKLRKKQPTRCIKYPTFLFCHKTLHVSGIFHACHQELSTVHSAIGTFRAGYVTAS
jgi:hypothetical protein